ncbi:MAG TPA: VCBS repeat-containing protein [Chryseosolibacter sp.]
MSFSVRSGLTITGFSFILLLSGCTRDKELLFSKLSPSDTGIDFVNVNHETERSNILTYEYFYNGGGVAMGDINNDGLTDLYFTSNVFENKLYLNKGNFEFEDITKASGTACEVGWKTGTTMADINGDGWLDIYVCRSASPDPERRRNLLFINNKNNSFTEAAKDYNLDDPSYSTQAAFFDYDRDGDLDAFLLNHSTLDISNSTLLNPKNSKIRFPNVGNKLLRNDNGKFFDVSDSLGVFGPASNYGLGISMSDINNDGWVDIYTGCDYTGRDRMLYNEKGTYFRDATEELSHISKFTMGTDIADVNGDGLMDIFTLDMLPEDNYRQKQLLGSDKYEAQRTMVRNGLHHQYMRNMLQLNLGNGSFAEVGQLAGISNTDWSWGGLIADFDSDGAQDIFITNGFKRDLTDNDFAKFKAFEEMGAAQRQGKKVSFLTVIGKFTENKLPNYMFRNDGQLNFVNVTKDWGLDDVSLSNGVAYGDLDNDGDLDLAVNNVNDPAGVYRNNTNEQLKNNYLIVKFPGGSNSFGTRVTVYTNGKTFVREHLPVRGFQSSVDHRLHFGLGTISKIDSLVVAWPDGTEQSFEAVGANQTFLAEKGNARFPAEKQTRKTVLQRVPSAITFRHQENEFIDFREQALLPRMYSREGPGAVAGDVNGDGIDDVFFGGAKNQLAELWIGKSAGGYSRSTQPDFAAILGSEITDAVFFDADGDKDNDLYVVTGGYEFANERPRLQDFLLLNDGKGVFKSSHLPAQYSSGSCARPVDFDLDGDIDVFVAGRIVPGRYPEAAESMMLINDGKGNFTIDATLASEVKLGGMVTDARWININGDKFPDLVTVGEWMPVRIFINEQGKLRDQTKTLVGTSTNGFWNTVIAYDIDADGDQDLVAGNQGLNTQMHATMQQPVTLAYNDFDKNGSVDPIVNYYIQGISYPYPTRDELLEQVPSFKKKFTDYRSYSKATLKQVLTEEELKSVKELSVAEMRSCVFVNENGKFTMRPLPLEAQFAPVNALYMYDIDGDGTKELMTGGNRSATRSRFGKMTGNFGFAFRLNANKEFEFVSPSVAGIVVDGDVVKILEANNELIYVVNDRSIEVYRPSKAANNPIARNENR